MKDEFRRLTMGSTHQTIYMPDIRRLAIPVPPREEQLQIVEHLRSRLPHIDSLISKKQSLLALLGDERASLVNRIITRGHAGARARGAGASSDGWSNAPTHWRLTKLMHLTPDDRQIMYGIVLPGPDVEEGVFIVKGGNCEDGRLSTKYLAKTTFEIEERFARARLRAGDIVFAIRGSIGSAQIVPIELQGANITQDVARISPRPEIESRWLLYAVRSYAFFSKLDAEATGATIRGINIWNLKRATIAVPPPAEQREIADFLDQELGSRKCVEATLRDSIRALMDYRLALISAMVTGKADASL